MIGAILPFTNNINWIYNPAMQLCFSQILYVLGESSQLGVVFLTTSFAEANLPIGDNDLYYYTFKLISPVCTLHLRDSADIRSPFPSERVGVRPDVEIFNSTLTLPGKPHFPSPKPTSNFLELTITYKPLQNQLLIPKRNYIIKRVLPIIVRKAHRHVMLFCKPPKVIRTSLSAEAFCAK